MIRSPRLVLIAVFALLAPAAGDWFGERALQARQTSLNVAPLTPSPTIPPTQAQIDALAGVLTGPGVTISNVAFTGDPRSAGTFVGGVGVLGIADGVVLSSGKVVDVLGPNDSEMTSTSFNTPGDPDLQTLIPAFPTFDATVLEFDLTATNTTSSHVTFRYVFTSEEHNEFSNQVFNNVFGFFVNGINYAVLPDAVTVVSINNINLVNNPSFFINNATCSTYTDHAFENNCITGPGLHIEADGLTQVLTFRAPLQPGTNHIRLGIADAGDSIYDSWVFIEAGSFTTPAPELCNPDGSPNGFDEDGDGFFDEDCRIEGTADDTTGTFSPGDNTRTYTFNFADADPNTPEPKTTTLAITEDMVLATHNVSVFAVLRDPLDIKPRLSVPPFHVTTNCVPLKMNDLAREMCVEYIVAEGDFGDPPPQDGSDYTGPITWVNEFKVSQRFLFGEWGTAHDPGSVPGNMFTEDILDSIVIDPNEDPIGTASSDNFSGIVMVFTPDIIVEATRDNLLTPAVGAFIAADDYTPMTTPDSVPVACTPPAGTRFALGINPVSCSATYNSVSATGGFVVTVVDTTAPSITVPADQTVEATGPGGALVNFDAPTATDIVDEDISILCSHAPGTFPLGTTVVTCSATDDFNNSTTDSFTVTVEDTTAPTFTADPPDINVVATSASGAVATFATPTATDLVDTSVDVTCMAPSGSTFAIGQNTVVCTATDDAGNSATVDFSVNVGYNLCALYDQNRTHKSGSTVPIKVRLCTASGENLSSPSVTLTATALSLIGDVVSSIVEDSGAANPSDNFRYDAALEGYIFNLSTKGLTSGQWRLDTTTTNVFVAGYVTFGVK